MSKLDEFERELNSGFDEVYTSGVATTFKKLGYVMEKGKITLSFSRTETLHKCPRKFLLKELKGKRSRSPSIDTAYGHAMGAGIQELFRSGSLERAWLAAGAAWDYVEYEDPWGKKKDKSFWMCLWSLELFSLNVWPSISEEYELAYLEGTPGIELFVYLDLGTKYSYQVHIDLVLRNKLTGALCVGEIKTSGMRQQEANWGNADQTAGYYAIIEALSDRLGLPFEPTVIYIVQETGKQLDFDLNSGFHIFPYTKSKDTSLDFLRTQIANTEIIDMYLESNYFPKRGSACIEYSRPCEFYGTCDLSSSQLYIEDEGESYESLSLEDVHYFVTTDQLLGILRKHETK